MDQNEVNSGSLLEDMEWVMEPYFFKINIQINIPLLMKEDVPIVNSMMLDMWFILIYFNFSPPVNPAKEIVDPNDRKPKDWDEREK